MKRFRSSYLFFFCLVLLMVLGTFLTAHDGVVNGLSLIQEEPLVEPAKPSTLNDAICQQIVVNPQLDVLEFGPGTGTAEPWYFMDPIIYYFKEGDGSGLAYDGYSLVLPDGDEGDPTPSSDILSQIVQLENNLQSVTVAYQRAMLDPNPADKVFGELWQLTSEGVVDLGNPQTYRVFRWTVSDSKDAWAEEVIELDDTLFARLNGQEIALLLRTVTDGGGATTADEEWVLFDDVTMTACHETARIYLPVVRGN